MVEQKDLKKAKRLLGRIRLIQGCDNSTGEIGNLVQSLEELLGKKMITGAEANVLLYIRKGFLISFLKIG